MENTTVENLLATHRRLISHILNKQAVAPKNGKMISYIFNDLFVDTPPFLCYIHQRNGCMIFTDGEESALIVDKMRWLSARYLRKLRDKCQQHNVQYCMILESGKFVDRAPPVTKTTVWNEYRKTFQEEFLEVRKKFYSRLETPVPCTPQELSNTSVPGR